MLLRSFEASADFVDDPASTIYCDQRRHRPLLTCCWIIDGLLSFVERLLGLVQEDGLCMGQQFKGLVSEGILVLVRLKKKSHMTILLFYGIKVIEVAIQLNKSTILSLSKAHMLHTCSSSFSILTEKITFKILMNSKCKKYQQKNKIEVQQY